MHHPVSLFTDPSYAELPLRQLAQAFDTWQEGRTKPIKDCSRKKYRYSLDKLLTFMERQQIPTELSYLHPHTVDQFVVSCRRQGHTEDAIASVLICVKVFANQFCVKQRDLCLADPLRKVSRITPPEKELEVLTADEIAAVLDSFGDVTFEDIRNRAFVAVLLVTGLRLRECAELTMRQWEPSLARFTVYGKGDRIRYAVIADRALKMFQTYLRMRPRHTSDQIWLTREGGPITTGGWQMMFKRLKVKSGVPRVRAHLLRHTFGSGAIKKGAERAMVQDMLGHQTDVMTRRYTRAARKETAASAMPQFSVI